ncbi:Gfo/Idh/MocA family oxidoreductase [bacterium]|nr:Gfo/Idh/MocA family oxidoreductase [bacterium]
MESLSVGLVGVTGHGTTILNAILAAGNLRLHSCYDANQALAGEFADRTGALLASAYEELLADPGLHAVVLVTPNDIRYQAVLKAVAARKHILVETPIATTVAEARAMVEMTRSAGLVFMAGHNARRRKVVRRARQILSEGTIGKIVAAEANTSRPTGMEPGLPAWRSDPKISPLLPMTHLGIHMVDVIEYLLGPIRRVCCIAQNVAMPGMVFDSTAALLELESGTPCTLSSSYVSPEVGFLRIYGTKGAIHCGSASLDLELLRENGRSERTVEKFRDQGEQSYVEQMREFGECVLNGRVPETDGEVGLRAVAVVEAMRASLESSALVSVNDILGEIR